MLQLKEKDERKKILISKLENENFEDTYSSIHKLSDNLDLKIMLTLSFTKIFLQKYGVLKIICKGINYVSKYSKCSNYLY